MRLSPFSVLILFAGLMLAGLLLLPGLGLKLQDDTRLPSLSIHFLWPGVHAVQVEREVTSRIEGALNTMRHVRHINSTSFRGAGTIQLELDRNADMDKARFTAATIIRRLYPSLPGGVSVPEVVMGRAPGRGQPLLTYHLLTDASGTAVTQYLEKQLLPALFPVSGLGPVKLEGNKGHGYELIYDTKRQEQARISVRDMQEALGRQLHPAHIGHRPVRPGEKDHGIRQPVLLLEKSAGVGGWKETGFGVAGKRLIHLSDIARTRQVEKTSGKQFRVNGRNSIRIQLFAKEGVNQLSTAASVRAIMEDLQGVMPDQWQLVCTHDDTRLIRRDLRRVGLRILLSAGAIMLLTGWIRRDAGYLLLLLTHTLATMLLTVIACRLLDLEMNLYSLAGITVSFGLVVDNGLVMTEHMRRHGDKKVFLSMLAATLTTGSCLLVILLAGTQQSGPTGDFVRVMMIKLSLSLAVAWFLVPALYRYTRIAGKQALDPTPAGRHKTMALYCRALTLARKYRGWMLLAFVLAFGLPVHLLPPEAGGKGPMERLYDGTVGSRVYQDHMRNTTERILGGSWRLFSRQLVGRSHLPGQRHAAIHVNVQLPDGASLSQLDRALGQMEDFVLQFQEVRKLVTQISPRGRASMQVSFEETCKGSCFPPRLQQMISSQALDIGGAEWMVWGVGAAFSSVPGSGPGGHGRIIFEGYHYDQLERLAVDMKRRILDHPRIHQAAIRGGEGWGRTGQTEHYLSFDEEAFALSGLSRSALFGRLREVSTGAEGPGIDGRQGVIPLRLTPTGHMDFSLWDLGHQALTIRGQPYKTAPFLTTEKRTIGLDIHKRDQQYRLSLTYQFQGPRFLEQEVRAQYIEEAMDSMPLGYRAYAPDTQGHESADKLLLLVLLVIAITYVLCAILLESLVQPLAVISLIPVSLTGSFLCFALLDLSFDQGALASFVLLGGLAVNAGLYVLNDFRHLQKRETNRGLVDLYVTAFEYKMLPVMLSLASTIIGLIPFLAGEREAFWFTFAAGTAGGLVFALIGLLCLFPLLLGGGRTGRVRDPG